MIMKRYWLGILLIALGAIFLLDSLGVVTFRSLMRHFWPVLLILVGIGILLKDRKSKS